MQSRNQRRKFASSLYSFLFVLCHLTKKQKKNKDKHEAWNSSSVIQLILIHHLSSSRPLSLRLQTPALPWCYSRETDLCWARNFKVYAPLPFFVFSLFSQLFSQYLSPLLLFSPCFVIIYFTTSLSFPAPSLLFLSPSISLRVNPTSPNTSKACVLSSCTVAVIYLGGWADGLRAKARYPQGRIQKALKHCTLSGAASVEKIKVHIRKLVKFILGIVRL